MNFSKKETLKFLVGGGCAVITDFILYHVFLYIGIELSISKSISFIAGSIVGFIINKFWTFESLGFSVFEVLKYCILYSITAVINAIVNKLILDWFQISILAFLCATGISTILNFLGQKIFVFYKKEGRATK